MKEVRTGNLQILQPATSASYSGTKTSRYTVIGIIVGIAVGVWLVLFLEYLDNTIKSTEQIRKNLNLNTLGLVPYLPEEVRTINPEIPDSIIAEVYRHIMNNLRYTSFIHNQKTIMISSPLWSEGTTTMTMNAGISSAMQGKSVLLMDCDLRRAILSKNLGVDRKNTAESNEQSARYIAGITDYLVEEAELNDIIRPTKYPNLSFIPAGTKVPNPAELLNSSKMNNLFRIVEKKYDVVFIDSPAIIPIVDTAILGSMVDGIMFVLEWRRVPVAIAQEAVKKLIDSKSNIIGCVVNKMRWTKRHHYYYYYYESGGEDVAFNSIRERRSWQRRLKERLFGRKNRQNI